MEREAMQLGAFQRLVMYASPASATVRRCAPAITTSVSMRRRSSRSACTRVSPSARAVERFRPIRRLTRTPPAHQVPYQTSRPPLSQRTNSRPVP